MTKVALIIIDIFAYNTSLQVLGKYLKYNRFCSIEDLSSFDICFVVITSCNPTKYVPEGETLLDKNTIVVNNDGV